MICMSFEVEDRLSVPRFATAADLGFDQVFVFPKNQKVAMISALFDI
jgi:hypothetical protein